MIKKIYHQNISLKIYIKNMQQTKFKKYLYLERFENHELFLKEHLKKVGKNIRILKIIVYIMVIAHVIELIIKIL